MISNIPEASWRRAVLMSTQTIEDAIACLDASGLQIVLVVSDIGVLLGTITDGDIRRGLLRGLNLSACVTDVLHANALVMTPQVPKELAVELMRANRIMQLPVVDEHRIVIGLYVWDDMAEAQVRPNIMVIMAGGRGVRLMPHTENCPKPMLQVGGKPMMEHILLRAKAQGFRRFLISINYLGVIVENYFKDGSAWGVEIDYIRENQPLGTGGALSLLNAGNFQESVVVTNGDVLTEINYADMLDFHLLHGASATMAARLYEIQNPFGVVDISGFDIIGFQEKPIYRSYVNAGIYVLNPRALSLLIKDEFCDMPTLFDRLREQGSKIIAYPMHENWVDVGRPDDLDSVRKDLKFKN